MDDSVMQAADNFASQVAYTAERSGGRVQRWKGHVFADSLSPHRYRNMAVVTHHVDANKLSEFTDQLRSFYDDEDSWIVASFFPTELDGSRLTIDCVEELMIFPAGKVEVPDRPGFQVSEVVTSEDVALFEQLWAKAYEKPHLLVEGARRYDERILGGGQRHRLRDCVSLSILEVAQLTCSCRG